MSEQHATGPYRLDLPPNLRSTHLTLMTTHIEVIQSPDIRSPYIELPDGVELSYDDNLYKFVALQAEFSEGTPALMSGTIGSAAAHKKDTRNQTIPTLGLHLPSSYIAASHHITSFGPGTISFENTVATRLYALAASTGNIALRGVYIEDVAVLIAHQGNVEIVESTMGQEADIQANLKNISIQRSGAELWRLPRTKDTRHLNATCEDVTGECIYAWQADHISTT